ncbi:MAG: type II toxin-antitoxin system RelE/ParE family toxin [Bacteroidota bacterium]
MEITIEWSLQSEKHLKQIFDYYCLEVSLKIAKKTISKIIDRVSILQNNPLAGPIEELLIQRRHKYRYLVENNYKIIYQHDENVITIAAIFDCRQHPEKMSKTGI